MLDKNNSFSWCNVLTYRVSLSDLCREFVAERNSSQCTLLRILKASSFLIYFCFMDGILFKNGPFLTSFSLFSSFQYTVESKQMLNINNFFPMTGFEPQTSGIGSDHSTN